MGGNKIGALARKGRISLHLQELRNVEPTSVEECRGSRNMFWLHVKGLSVHSGFVFARQTREFGALKCSDGKT